MGLFDFLNIDVLTDLEGVVTVAGKPASGVKVVLNVRVVFNDDKVEVISETTSDGRFHFDAIKMKSVNSFLPSAKMVEQKITFLYEGKTYLGWEMVKNNYQYNGELNDLSESVKPADIIPLSLLCDLNNESITRKAGTHEHVALTGICRWQGELTK